MAWVEGSLNTISFKPSLNQVFPSPIPPGLEFFQEWDIHNFPVNLESN